MTPRLVGRMPFQRLRPALPIDNVLVIRIAYLADRRQALDKHLAGLSGRQLQQRVFAFLGNQLSLRTGRTRHLRALARPQLDGMHRRARRNVLQRQRVAHQDVRIGTGGHRRANLQANRLQDVALLAIRVVHQRDAGRTVRIVLNGRHTSRNSVLVALEVDQAKLLLVPAAVMADGQVARIAASARTLA